MVVKMVEEWGAAATRRQCSFSLCCPAWRVLARVPWVMGRWATVLLVQLVLLFVE
jgi:hypothetical protein